MKGCRELKRIEISKINPESVRDFWHFPLWDGLAELLGLKQGVETENVDKSFSAAVSEFCIYVQQRYSYFWLGNWPAIQHNLCLKFWRSCGIARKLTQERGFRIIAIKMLRNPSWIMKILFTHVHNFTGKIMLLFLIHVTLCYILQISLFIIPISFYFYFILYSLIYTISWLTNAEMYNYFNLIIILFKSRVSLLLKNISFPVASHPSREYVNCCTKSEDFISFECFTFYIFRYIVLHYLAQVCGRS